MTNLKLRWKLSSSRWLKQRRANVRMHSKKSERTNALKEVKRLCKEFGFTAGMLKGSLAEERNQNKITFTFQPKCNLTDCLYEISC